MKNKDLASIWNILVNKNIYRSVSIDEIISLAKGKGLIVEKAEQVKFGFNPKVEAIQLFTNKGSALYPRKRLNDLEIYKNNIAPRKNVELFWKRVDWFLPPFECPSETNEALQISHIQIKNHSSITTKELQKRFETSLSTLYSFDKVIPIVEQVFSESLYLKKHIPLIRESIFSFYSGMKIVAFSSLIPIMEDVLRSISDSDTDLDLISVVNSSVKKAIDRAKNIHTNNADWAPTEFIEISTLKVTDNRVYMLELIREWLVDSFYSNTSIYDNHSGFNRHIFAHAKSEVWQNEFNFFRALGLLQALAFIECFAVQQSQVSILPPEPNLRSKSVVQEIMVCINLQLIKQLLVSSEQLQKALPFNPTASGDGWLLRSSILAETTDKEIVRKLRDNGWNCYSVSDPVKNGEYTLVSAEKNKKNITVALLYSCASSQILYQELDKICDFILYKGSPYREHEYAINIKKAEVRPLSSWLVPN